MEIRICSLWDTSGEYQSSRRGILNCFLKIEGERNCRCFFPSSIEYPQPAKERRKIRDAYWPEGTLPIGTEKIVEFRLKLDIEPVRYLLATIDMDAYLTMDMTGIVVDYDCYMNARFANRMRFSFAHELGHFFLHREIFSILNPNSPEEWKDLF